MGTGFHSMGDRQSTLAAEQESEVFAEHSERIEQKNSREDQFPVVVAEYEALLTLNPQKVHLSSLDDALESIQLDLSKTFDPENEQENPWGAAWGKPDNLLEGKQQVEDMLRAAKQPEQTETGESAEEVLEEALNITARIELRIQEEYEIYREQIRQDATKRWVAWAEKMSGSNYVLHAEPS